MKKLIAAAVFAASSSVVMAANGPAGCGLGTAVIFPDASAFHEHLLAATTNGTSGNQTFGMTSGTLGCESANGPLAGTQSFFDDNLDQLASDVARGKGETLNALAQLIGIEAADQATFAGVMQANFDAMFSADATSASASAAMKDAMASEATLAKYLG
jgi:hypothetical protein